MSLRSLTQTYVDTYAPGQDAFARGVMVDRLVNSGHLFLTEGDTVLNIRADSASASFLGTGKLPTRITSAAATLLTLLEELQDKGVFDTQTGKLVSRKPGATIQVIP